MTHVASELAVNQNVRGRCLVSPNLVTRPHEQGQDAARGGDFVEPKGRLSKRTVLGGAALVLLGACAGAAGALAARWPAPDLSPLARATEPVVVFSEVSEQPLRKPVNLVGIIHPPETKDVFAPGTETVTAAAEPLAENAGLSSGPGNPSAPRTAAQAGNLTAVPGTGDNTDPDSAKDSPPEPDKPPELQTLRLVVTTQKASLGKLISPGGVVAEVSGRPVFAMPTAMPFYRNLAVGAKGADVSALQGLLQSTGHFGGAVDGVFGSSTLAGLNSLYRGAGYDLPVADGVNRGFVLSEFAEVADSPVTVIEAAAAGTPLGDGKPLVRVVIGAAWVSARVSMLDVEALAVGAEVTVMARGAEPLTAVVSSVGEYQDDGTPGYDIEVKVPVDWFDTLDGEQQAALSPTGDVPVGPAVPLTAVREDPDGAYVLAPAQDPADKLERVPVTITGQVGGYALIIPDEALPVGQRIVMSGDPAAES
ncbi:MAG: hypothetical protein LBC97_03490 [Bifidobacteriaceae bacterium]|nr:hypothetical protein [Bifidobacteriaceae bacterium]